MKIVSQRGGADFFTTLPLTSSSNIVFENGRPAHVITDKHGSIDIGGAADLSDVGKMFSPVRQTDVDHLVSDQSGSDSSPIISPTQTGLQLYQDDRSLFQGPRIVSQFVETGMFLTVLWCVSPSVPQASTERETTFSLLECVRSQCRVCQTLENQLSCASVRRTWPIKWK